MSHKVTMIRNRTVEEKIVTIVSASDPRDAIAACQHLVDNHSLDWRYNKTLETGESSVKVEEVKSKRPR